MTGASEILRSRTIDLDSPTLYRILRLRADVFVVEQECVFNDLDGRDLEPETEVCWIEHDGDVVATLRMIVESDGSCRVGRVAVRASSRGLGFAAALMRKAFDLAGDRVVVLDAQSQLSGWYQRLGFVVDGPDFVEDGILHTPMRRP